MKTNYPEDDDNTMYLLDMTWSVDDLLVKIKVKWGEEDFSNIIVRPEYRHVDCIGYDLYDPGDYETYLVLERIVR